jgi:hypothetical protein
MSDVVFDDSAKSFVLEAFGKKVNESGYIVEHASPNREIIAQDGTHVRVNRFAGVRKGSEVYIKSDLISLIELCDALKTSE